jgi:hypothetical protein
MSEPEPWTEIFNKVKVEIPGAVDAVIRQQIFSVMADFTGSVPLWQEDVPFVATPGTLVYPLTVTDGRMYRLMRVYKADDPRQTWVQGGISMRIPGQLRIWQSPNEQQNWVAVVAKACSNPVLAGDPPKSTGYPAVDEWIVQNYHDVISYGALSYMYRMPAKSYSNPKAAADNNASYMAGKAQARSDNIRANVYNGQAWTFPQDFATVSKKGWT